MAVTSPPPDFTSSARASISAAGAAMTWVELFSELERKGLVRETTGTPSSVTVTARDVRLRRVERGHVFVALQAATSMVQHLLRRPSSGVRAVVSESPAACRQPRAPVDGRERARVALAVLAAAFYRQPSTEMQVVGVTGTNGKTTTAYLLRVDLRSRRNPVRSARHGRLPHRRALLRDATHTTPEAPEVQALLREMVDLAAAPASMEVLVARARSHRVDEVTFAAGVFTEPDPRPPRFPRRHGSRTFRRNGGSSTCCRRDAPGADQPRRSRGRDAGRARSRGR